MNLSWSRQLLERLCREGVEDFVFCAGARNSPLIVTLDKARGLKPYSFFEERSAAFFALGLARHHARPVAIITTSGTAAAELLPATIEAYHTGVPLILVTADRPRRLRGTGAPQAIDQTGLFAKFVEREFDLELGQLPDFGGWSRRSPLHVNVCFDEPLIDEKHEPFKLEVTPSDSFLGRAAHAKTSGASRITAEAAQASIREFLKSASASSLLVLVGTLETKSEREAVSNFVRALGAPVYCEGPSGLREDPSLADLSLRAGDKILPLALKKFGVSKVLRLGGIPTARVWRDLESGAAETLSVTSLPFSGLSRGELVWVDLAQTFAGFEVKVGGDASSLLKLDREIFSKLESLLTREPKSEAGLFRALSEKIPHTALTYLGNSLPIREWDLAATYRGTPRAIEANRGVNGIDGQLSTFLGLSRDSGANYCIVGDLTALYDLAGPWAASQKKLGACTIVVINNGGGKIFNRIFSTELFENRHSLDFANWAAQWKWAYEKWTEIPSSLPVYSKPVVIEVCPDADSTKRFWDQYDGFFA